MPGARRTVTRSLTPRSSRISANSNGKRQPFANISTRKQIRKVAMLSSDSNTDGEPAPKKIKLSNAKQSVKVKNSVIKVETLQPKVEIGVSSQKTVSPRQKETVIKEDAQDVSHNEEEISKIKEELSPVVGLSEYELRIQKNIEARSKFMESLEIFSAKENLLEVISTTPKRVKKVYRGIASEPKAPVRPEDIRRSLRQRKQTPDVRYGVLPNDKDIKNVNREDRSRRPPGPAPLMDYYERDNKKACEEFLRDIREICGSQQKTSVWSGSKASVLKVMKSLKIDDNHVAKVTPRRTYSMQIHPSEDKILVLVGGKGGELGVWDVERDDQTAGAYCFDVHSRPINCLTLKSSNPEHVYTTSYDGTVRRTDLVSGIVQQVYSHCDPDTYNRYISWHAHRGENCLLVASNEGRVAHIDMRKPAECVKRWPLHHKSVKIVTVHPTRNTYFATASADNTVCLWDMRHHGKNKPISQVEHKRGISGLEFSPVTGNSLVSTSLDNYLRIISCDLTTLQTTKKIYQDNQTGRWLTTFKARFVPGREDLVIVGSMKYPRRKSVYDTEGNLQYEFMGESMSSITSITAMHPTRAIVAGSNSSGKAFVFTSGL